MTRARSSRPLASQKAAFDTTVDVTDVFQGTVEAAALREAFVRCAEAAGEAAEPELASAAATMADLMSVAVLFSEDPATHDRARELIEFGQRDALPAISCLQTPDAVRQLAQLSQERWGHCLELLSPGEKVRTGGHHPWSESHDEVWEGDIRRSTADSGPPDGPLTPYSSLEIGRIMETLQGGTLAFELQREELPQPAGASVSFHPVAPSTLPRPPVTAESIDDPELVAAFADDAQVCLAQMEAGLLELESGRGSADTLRAFCRQLHTLKGAAGTVGLAQLASYLHQLESWIEAGPPSAVSVDQLLECIDTVRAQLTSSGSSDFPISDVGAAEPAVQSDPQSVAPESFRPQSQSAGAGSTEGDGFVRIEAARLERLMDLLAELVVLRNHRDAHGLELRSIHRELTLCAARTRTLTTAGDLPASRVDGGESHSGIDPRRPMEPGRFLSRSLSELAADTTELSRSLQEVSESLSVSNASVSHLIGQFRQELLELRRLPMNGLFQRLQRAIRDAARVEGKVVEIHLEGQGARADRGLQQRLFEPLLHLVRNAVSHGIQTAEERLREGKSAAGRITLCAWADAASLYLEVRDDGRGINEQALEKRGRELGLLPPGEVVNSSQLRQLIFHPGFSTRTSVNAVSGRGVGLDVVDNWVRRLRGRIDVESVPGSGTTFRMRIPLRSAVEHAMIVRAGGQLFALPMHSVNGTTDARLPLSGSGRTATQAPARPLNQILNLRDPQSARSCHVSLREAARSDSRGRTSAEGMTISVDEIVGVEEVVVRPLPSLLQRNELFAGVTLSGRGDTVLLIDTAKLTEFSRWQTLQKTPQGAAANGTATAGSTSDSTDRWDSPGGRNNRTSILVVDDSVVVRRSLSRRLQAAGWLTREAGDGLAALRILRSGGIGAVVTDVDMPAMNGVELLQELKRQKPFRTLPVIVLSSRDEDSLPPELRSLHPTAILKKPVTNDTITAILELLADAGLKHPLTAN